MTSRDVVRRHRARRRKARTERTHRAWRSILAVVLAVPLLFVLMGSVLVGAAAFLGVQQYNDIAATVGPAEDVVNEFSRGGAKVYDRNGVLLYEFVDRSVGLRRPIPLDAMSHWAVSAAIDVEDPDFWNNPGINVRGTLRAGVENLTPLLGNEDFFEGSGGSSITQQLARNVYMTYEQRQERTVDRKFREMVIALELTERYSKEQILEWYLNLLPYGGIYVGLEAAAEGYFGKSASELNLAEAALLAGIPQTPARYNPLAPQNLDVETRDLAPASPAKGRQLEVLELMVRAGTITYEEAEQAYSTPLHFRQERFEIEAPHFVLGRIADEITARFGEDALYRGGLTIETTLDLELQNIAQEIVDRNVEEFGIQANLHNGAYIALDPHTGQILVYLASRDYFNEEIEGKNDNIMARNSPGSTLKPFTYLTAFTQGWGTGTAILDTPLRIEQPDGSVFEPRNPGTGFQGPVTTALALGNSFNIPAIKTMMTSGVAETIEMYQRFGYTTLDNPLGYGPALTTGGGEITLMDQAIAYSVLATGGIMRGQEAVLPTGGMPGNRTLEPVALLRVTDSEGQVIYEFTEPAEERIVDEAYAYMISSILQDPQNTCITYSTCGALSLANGYPSAAKTGTSEPFEQRNLIGETWTMGYTPHIVSGIWAGNADNDPIQGISSTTVSLRAWKEFTEAAIEYLDLPATDFSRPNSVVEREVCWPSGKLPTDACPSIRRYTSLYAADVFEREDLQDNLYDSWWQRRGGGVRLVFPPEDIEHWPALRSWAGQHGVSGYIFGISSPQSTPTPAPGQPQPGQPQPGQPQPPGQPNVPGPPVQPGGGNSCSNVGGVWLCNRN